MAKVEIDDKIIANLLGDRERKYNKAINQLQTKLGSKDKKIKKLERELELLKANNMDATKEVAERIAKFSRAFVGELQRANWVDKYYECGQEHCADDDD